MTKLLFAAFLTLLAVSAFGQRPGGRPGDQIGRPGAGQPPRDSGPIGQGPNRPGGQPQPGEWVRPHDTNQNGNIEAEEFQAAMDRTFAELDRNKNGSIDTGEAVRPPKPEDGPRPPVDGNRPGQPDRLVQPGQPGQPGPDGKRILPPFFFLDRVLKDGTFSRADFDRIVRGVFNEMDKNGDGTLIRDEARQLPRRPGDKPPPQGPNMAPNAKFIGAEMRFGDRLVKGQPFSAEIVIEDTKRLFDGTTVTKLNRGAIYRDGEGRTRREQPLEMVGGVSIVGNGNQPQMLVFINDFASQSQIFLDLNARIARKNPLGGGPGPLEPTRRPDAKEESLGTKTLDGVSIEGTRITFEIPAGQIGNEKPMQVIDERWFSKELQVIVMSRHLDPVAGEHVFKLINIKRAEPRPELFAIPTGFKIEGPGVRKPGE